MSEPRAIDPQLAATLRAAFDSAAFGRLIGQSVEAVAAGYARMRLAASAQLLQPGGVMHGGAIASLLDSAAALAVFSTLTQRPKAVATIDLHVHYLEAVVDEDLVAEARVRRSGRSIAIVGVDVHTAAGRAVAHGELSFRVVLDAPPEAPQAS